MSFGLVGAAVGDAWINAQPRRRKDVLADQFPIDVRKLFGQGVRHPDFYVPWLQSRR